MIQLYYFGIRGHQEQHENLLRIDNQRVASLSIGDGGGSLRQLDVMRLYHDSKLLFLVLGEHVLPLHPELAGKFAQQGQGADRVVPAVPLIKILTNLDIKFINMRNGEYFLYCN